jgi:hypothetical protein
MEEKISNKTPDFTAVHNDKDAYVEVKCINPEKAEEQRMIMGLVEFVELDPDWWKKVKNKILDALKDSKAKFEAVGAYVQNCKRYVYMSVIWWSANATAQHEQPEALTTKELIHGFEREFNVELIFFKTF